MTQNGFVPGEPDEEGIRYDLAGNPLPPLPSATPQAVQAPLAETPPAPRPAPPRRTLPSQAPGYTPPPGSAPPGGMAPAWGGTPTRLKSSEGPILYVGLGIAAVLVLALIFGVRALKPAVVTAPTSYKTYTAIDNTFSCDQPDGWKMKETGVPGGTESQVTFSQGHVRVHIISDATGSLMADATSAGNANLPPEQQKPPVQKLHDMDKQQLAADLPDYQEGDATTFQTAVGDSRLSEWHATGGFGEGKLHGYRVTMLDKDREITVICFAPDRNWSVLQPAFQHMINSVKPGNG